MMNTGMKFLTLKGVKLESFCTNSSTRTNRSIQPVITIAEGISRNLQIPCVGALVKTKGTPELKNIFDYQRRSELLKDAFDIRRPEVKGKIFSCQIYI